MKTTVGLLLMTVLLVACDEDKPGGGGGGPVTPDPALANLWPDQDGNQWVYRVTARDRSGQGDVVLFETPEEVPDAPPMDEMAAFVASDDFGPAATTTTGFMDLAFEGEATTASGVTGQSLVSTLRPDGIPPEAGAESPGRGYLRQLARARPDLVGRIRELHPDLDLAPKRALFVPLFLGGDTYLRNDEVIAYLNDLDQEPRFQLLTADLEVGAEWSTALSPQFAPDIVLRARILESFNASSELGLLKKTLEILYVLDYGLARAVDEGGHELGYFRALQYGVARYAPTVGPIYLRERTLVTVGKDGDDVVLGPGEEEWEGDLTEFSPAEVQAPD